MSKAKFQAKNFLYPMPTTLVGTIVNGEPNFITIAHVGILKYPPPVISISLHRSHHSNPGIKLNRTFSINIPSMELVEVTDYCGLVSGKNVDKAELFDIFYGDLETAPMIKECPINMELSVIEEKPIDKHEVFIGEVVNSYVDENYLTDGLPDLGKVRPILFSFIKSDYWEIGKQFAKAWHVGKALKKK